MNKKKCKEELKRKLLIGVAIGVVFLVLALLVFIIALIIFNHKAIGTALGSIPGAIWKAVLSFPPELLIAGSIGAVLMLITCILVWHFVLKPLYEKQ